jgi:glycosyltransferase involved in cell wall biosynthesis
MRALESPLRIFHLVPDMNFGGLQKVVRLLAVSQKQVGHSVAIGCWTNAGNHPEAEKELESAGVNVLYLRRGTDGEMASGRMILLNRLKGHLDRRQADILHVHNPFGYYLYGALAARAAGATRIVNTIHATAMFDHPRFGSRGRAVFRIAAMLTDGFVSVCPEVDTFLRNRFRLPGRKLYVVDNGIDLSPFLAVPARQRAPEAVFGCAGRMAPEKNHRVLIDAFAMLYRTHGNIRLRLLGGGPLETTLKEHVRHLGLEDVVEFPGFSHDVPEFLSGLDIYVLPSDFEALPLSLLEAIASGLTVVATAVGGVPRIVENTGSGWLCPPGNANALMTAMELALAASDRGDRAEKARHLVAERYSVQRMARDYERVYQTLLHKKDAALPEPEFLKQRNVNNLDGYN